MQHQPTSQIKTGSRLIAVSNLIDAAGGHLNRDIFAALVRKYARETFGSTAPRYLREAAKLYRCHVEDQRLAWLTAHDISVATSYVRPFEGGFGSAF